MGRKTMTSKLHNSEIVDDDTNNFATGAETGLIDVTLSTCTTNNKDKLEEDSAEEGFGLSLPTVDYYEDGDGDDGIITTEELEELELETETLLSESSCSKRSDSGSGSRNASLQRVADKKRKKKMKHLYMMLSKQPKQSSMAIKAWFVLGLMLISSAVVMLSAVLYIELHDDHGTIQNKNVIDTITTTGGGGETEEGLPSSLKGERETLSLVSSSAETTTTSTSATSTQP